MSKVAIIGAGHGGLAAAARLKIKGHDVTVFESSQDVVTINQSLTLPAAYRDLFLKTGSALEDHVELIEVETSQNLPLENGQILSLPGSGLGRILSLIETKISSAAADQWRNYILAIGKVWLSIRNPLIETDSKNGLSKLKAIGFGTIRSAFTDVGLIKKHLTHPDLISLTQLYRSQTNVDRPTKLGLLSLNSYVHQIFGVYEPRGGLSELTAQLKGRSADLGVEFSFNESVKPVQIGNQIVGVETSSAKLISFDYVIFNDLENLVSRATWLHLPTVHTSIAGFYRIIEKSWLGIGPSQAVLSAEVIALDIGSAAR
jgi:phytoene dehydrogenase-like protein